MSKLTETKRAYDAISRLVDKEILKNGSNIKDLNRFKETLDVSFYLLGWSQFEHLVKKEAEHKIEGLARSKGIEGRAWRYMQQNLKAVALRKKLDVVFHSNETKLNSLNDDYDLRNKAAHSYKELPKEAYDISIWLASLEDLVDDFDT